MTFSQSRTCYVVWANTDGTEGRGRDVPIGWFWNETSALRFAVGKDVQGSPGRVEKTSALQSGDPGRAWFGPVNIEYPTASDEMESHRINAARLALKRARESGLSDEDIALIQRGPQVTP